MTLLLLLSTQHFFFSQRQSSRPPQVWNGFILSFHSFSLLFMPTNKRQTRGQKIYWQPRTKREISVCCSFHARCACPWTPPCYETELGHVWAFLGVSVKHQNLNQHGWHFHNTRVFHIRRLFEYLLWYRDNTGFVWSLPFFMLVPLFLEFSLGFYFAVQIFCIVAFQNLWLWVKNYNTIFMYVIWQEWGTCRVIYWS